MTDRDFVAAFEDCSLPESHFHHRDHLRLAWIYLQRYGREEAQLRIAKSITRYAKQLGKADKYHHTITIAWLELVHSARQSLHATASFDDALATFPQLLQQSALAEYYSSGLLGSDDARHEFVAPDLKPLQLNARMALSQDRDSAARPAAARDHAGKNCA